MIRFTTRHLIGLTIIAAAACVIGVLIAPSDPYSELLAAGFLFFFGGSCYVAGIALERRDKLPPPRGS